MVECKKINKRKARKLYEDGKTIFITPCKVSVCSMLILPFIANKKECEKQYGKNATSFDALVNSFEYYNCCYELGYYAAYYIRILKKEDYNG